MSEPRHHDEIALAIPWTPDVALPRNGYMIRFLDEREAMPAWRIELLDDAVLRGDGTVLVRGAMRPDGPCSFEVTYVSRELAVAELYGFQGG